MYIRHSTDTTHTPCTPDTIQTPHTHHEHQTQYRHHTHTVYIRHNTDATHTPCTSNTIYTPHNHVHQTQYRRHTHTMYIRHNTDATHTPCTPDTIQTPHTHTPHSTSHTTHLPFFLHFPPPWGRCPTSEPSFLHETSPAAMVSAGIWPFSKAHGWAPGASPVRVTGSAGAEAAISSEFFSSHLSQPPDSTRGLKDPAVKNLGGL